MLLNIIAALAQILSVACLVLTLVCIIIKKNTTYIPTLISLLGSVFYMIFLGCVAPFMDDSLEKNYVCLIVFYVLFAYIAHQNFKHSHKKNSAE